MEAQKSPAENNIISKNRLEALVDGVFAFAMTLLVVGLSVPDIPKADAAVELPQHIATMFPEFLSFLIAFLVLASFWIVHHEHFHYLKSVNGWVLWLNIFILIFVVLVPFSTNLSGDYPHVPIAPFIFHLNMLALGTLFLIQWQYIIRRPALLVAPVHPGRVQDAVMERFVVILSALSGIVLLALGAPFSTMYMYAVFPILIRILIWYLHRKQAASRGGAAA
jgi:Predicted integral membrane protein